jgi:hypothetical protein
MRIGISGGSGGSPGNEKASREDPGGSDHDGCVKRLASRRPPAGKRRKGKAESAQRCAGRRTGMHVSLKETDIYGCDAHARINAHQSRFCQWFDSICIVQTAFLRPVGVSRNDDRPHFVVARVRRHASRKSFINSRSISDGCPRPLMEWSGRAPAPPASHAGIGWSGFCRSHRRCSAW